MAILRTTTRTSGRGGRRLPPLDRSIIRQYLRANGPLFLRDPNVTSIGLETLDGEPRILFTVHRKLARGAAIAALGSTAIPPVLMIAGRPVRTDVVARSFRPSFQLSSPSAKSERKRRADPLTGGVSIGHPSAETGTLGLIVFDNGGAPFVLSNWHVLHGPRGAIGDVVMQPGPFDDNRTELNAAAILTRSHLGAAGDCAIAKIDGRGFDARLLDLGVRVTQLARPEEGDVVIKSSRTTGVTHGVVKRVDTMVKLDFGDSVGARAIGVFEIGPLVTDPPGYELSSDGDSGACWLVADLSGDKIRPNEIMVGLHVAGESEGEGDDEHALACYATSVFDKLEIFLAPPG